MSVEVKKYYENGVLVKTQEVYIIKEKDEVKFIGEIPLNPQFSDMVYEDNVSEAIKLILERIKGEDINLLFSGSAGTGKTSTAQMLSVETKRYFVYMTGSMAKKKIIDLLLSARENSIILIDEIHNLPEKIAEIIYPAIQDNEIYVEGEKRDLKLMFIGTTTEPERLPKPLISRFKIIEFEELSEEKLRLVLQKKGCSIEIADYLLNHTTNFRTINNLIDMIKLYGEINVENMSKAFRLKGINVQNGLSKVQDKYLEILKQYKKLGLRSLSLHLKRSEDYIKLEVEPDLIRKGFLNITSRGRELNPEFSEFSYEELRKEEEKTHSIKTLDKVELARRYLKENPKIKERFRNRYFELVQFIADKIIEGISPEEIDFLSFGNDVGVSESYENNYKGCLEEL